MIILRFHHHLCITISIFFILSIPPAISSAAGTATCTTAEENALLRFKSHLTDDGGVLSSWGKTPNCCNWHGIQCSNLTVGVTAVLLAGQSISGDLAASLPELGPLRHLQSLDLSSNDFSGSTIPATIDSIPALTYLNLSSCNLAGSIPSAVGNLSSLQTLDISINFGLSSDHLHWLHGLHSLRHLDLSTVNLSAALDWQLSVTNLSSLTNLSFFWCYLSHSQPVNLSSFPPLLSLNLPANLLRSSIFPWIYGFRHTLVDLDLSYNQLTALPVTTGDFCALKHLLLTGNNITQDAAEVFMALSGCTQPTLTLLDLDDNLFSDRLPDLPKFSALVALHLSRNSLSAPLRDDLRLPSTLSVLDLGSNSIGGPLPDPSVFSALRELYLGENQINGSVAPTLGTLAGLEVLDLSFNSINATLTETHLSGLRRLRHLDLSGNLLRLQTSPCWVPPFQLSVISLRGCQLGPAFPRWLSAQLNYSVLDASVSGISGPVPAGFWRLSPSLHYLNLSCNEISGVVPGLHRSGGVGPIVDLSSNNFSGPVPTPPPGITSFSLSGNRFSGNVEQALCAAGPLDSLSYVDLSGNMLSGELPDCFTGMASLTILRLDGNRFSGTVPPSVGSLSLLQSMHLRGNSFAGGFPPGISSCSRLKVLDLAGNRFSGHIPRWLGAGTLPDLTILSLGDNLFNGTLPSAVCQLSRLRVLDLSRNVFTGPLPSCLDNLTAMAALAELVGLNLSGNGLTGQISSLQLYLIYQPTC